MLFLPCMKWLGPKNLTTNVEMSSFLNSKQVFLLQLAGMVFGYKIHKCTQTDLFLVFKTLWKVGLLQFESENDSINGIENSKYCYFIPNMPVLKKKTCSLTEMVRITHHLDQMYIYMSQIKYGHQYGVPIWWCIPHQYTYHNHEIEIPLKWKYRHFTGERNHSLKFNITVLGILHHFEHHSCSVFIF